MRAKLSAPWTRGISGTPHENATNIWTLLRKMPVKSLLLLQTDSNWLASYGARAFDVCGQNNKLLISFVRNLKSHAFVGNTVLNGFVDVVAEIEKDGP